jgi:hypothetical protein
MRFIPIFASLVAPVRTGEPGLSESFGYYFGSRLYTATVTANARNVLRCFTQRKCFCQMSDVEMSDMEYVFFVGRMCSICPHMREESSTSGISVLKVEKISVIQGRLKILTIYFFSA